MIPSCFLFSTFIGLGLIAVSANAQEQFLDLEARQPALISSATQAHESSQGNDAFADLPTLAFANSEAILASYEESVKAIADLSKESLSIQDSETGADIQRSDRQATTLGTAGGFFSATLGVKTMQEKTEWDPLETQGAGSLEFAWRIPRSAFAGVAGLAGSYNRQNRNDMVFQGEVDTWTLEFYLGGKGYLEIPKSSIWAYGGAGVSFIYTDVEGTTYLTPNRTDRSDDWGVGVYAQLGILLRLNRAQSIGIEYRGLFGTNTSFFNSDLSVDYNQLSFVFLVAF